jgi:4-hydroxy-2-oxoheptanedioate aldolase
MIPSPVSAEIVASLGFDYLCIDMQHGLADYGELVAMLQSAAVFGPTPLVRVPISDYATAQRALDGGAEGIIFPYISNGADAARAVAACRYPPQGTRSYGPIRSRLHIGPDAAHANREVLCIVMIETREAIENLDDILDCDGVDAIYVGPTDLGLSLGGDEDALQTSISEILNTARQRGVPVGIHTSSGHEANGAIERGFLMATVTTDAATLTAAYSRELSAARGGEQVQKAGIYG